MPEKKCILVVDDHPETLRLISIILERNGFKALTATSGAEGIRKTQSDYPDLILMDIMMPQMTGVDACRALRDDSDPRVANSTIVMFSASANPADRDAATEAEADGYIVKPTMPKALIEMVNRFLENPHKRSADVETAAVNDKDDAAETDSSETITVGVLGAYSAQLATGLADRLDGHTVIDCGKTADNLPTNLSDIILTLSYSLTSVSNGKATIEQLKEGMSDDATLHVVLVNTGDPVSATEDMVGQLIEHPVACTVALDTIGDDAQKVVAKLLP